MEPDIELGSDIEIDYRVDDFRFKNKIKVKNIIGYLYLNDEFMPQNFEQGWDGEPFCNPDKKWYQRKIRHNFKVYGSSIYYQDDYGVRFWHYECSCGAWFERTSIITLRGSDPLHYAPGTTKYIK